MFEDVDPLESGKGYSLWAFLSKLLHAKSENWHDFARLDGETGTRSEDKGDSVRTQNLRALSGFLVLRNFQLIGNFDQALRLVNISSIENLWANAYHEVKVSSD
jgi:hypothetical protein